MKRTILLPILFLTIGFTNCNSTSADKANKDAKSENQVEHLTKASFIEKVFDFEKNKDWKYIGQKPCIIDFYANWCKPCKMIGPYLEEISTTYAGKINVSKINIDDEKELANAFNIQSIPAVLYCPMNGNPQMSVGALSKDEYIKMVHEILQIQ